MLISTPLNSIPFLSSSDSTRLQMSAKQLSQSVTCTNTRRPYVISKDWPYLSETTRLFKKVAPCDGEVLYSNIDLMIVLLLDDNGDSKLEIYNTPPYLETSSSFATSLRYKKVSGEFYKNEVLYEYDCFYENVPSPGYNINTMFMSFFGYNFEDSIIISENVSKMACAIKYKKTYLYIYSDSIFKMLYPESRYGFIPEIGQKIKGMTISSQLNKNCYQTLNLYNYGEMVDDEIQISSNSLICKLENAEVSDIKIHRIDHNRNKYIIDKALDQCVYNIKLDYATKIKEYTENFKEYIGPLSAKDILTTNYILKDAKCLNVRMEDLLYVIELDLKKEYPSTIGDKFANRFANKGVTNLILPSDLRPINTRSGEPIDVIVGPLAIYSRMNFGQILEAIISKPIQKVEREILADPLTIPDSLTKLSRLAEQLNEFNYAEEIRSITNYSALLQSIERGGLYFEAPSFVNIDIKQLKDFVETEFAIQIEDEIKIPRATFKYIKDKCGVDLPLPDKDMYYPKVFNSPVYLLKLMQLSESKSTSRDFGSYKCATKQPSKSRNGNSTGSRLGGMEMDALLAHNLPQVINEMRTVKSDCLNLKKDLVNQMLHTGVYASTNSEKNSFTKLIIEQLIKFLNN